MSIDDISWKTREKDEIHLTIPEAKPSQLKAQNIALDILYEDEHLIVINKPSGMVVHPAPGHADGTLVNALMAHCGNSLSGIGDEKRPGIVHRLDKDTSGVMVATKTDLAHQGLSEQFASHGKDGKMTRAYKALVWGRMIPSVGRIEAPLARHPNHRQKIAVSKHATARFAATQYTCLESWGNPAFLSLVKCVLETGRTHQIRVHMAHIGHPVFADELYGRGHMNRINKLPVDTIELMKTLNRQALHAYLLGFEHPITGETLQFKTELPILMTKLIENFRNI